MTASSIFGPLCAACLLPNTASSSSASWAPWASVAPPAKPLSTISTTLQSRSKSPSITTAPRRRTGAKTASPRPSRASTLPASRRTILPPKPSSSARPARKSAPSRCSSPRAGPRSFPKPASMPHTPFANCDVILQLCTNGATLTCTERRYTVLQKEVPLKDSKQYLSWYDDAGASGTPFIQLRPAPIADTALSKPTPDAPAASSGAARASDPKAANLVREAMRSLQTMDLGHRPERIWMKQRKDQSNRAEFVGRLCHGCGAASFGKLMTEVGPGPGT